MNLGRASEGNVDMDKRNVPIILNCQQSPNDLLTFYQKSAFMYVYIYMYR